MIVGCEEERRDTRVTGPTFWVIVWVGERGVLYKGMRSSVAFVTERSSFALSRRVRNRVGDRRWFLEGGKGKPLPSP